jgi:hypothetical protein
MYILKLRLNDVLFRCEHGARLRLGDAALFKTRHLVGRSAVGPNRRLSPRMTSPQSHGYGLRNSLLFHWQSPGSTSPDRFPLDFTPNAQTS